MKFNVLGWACLGAGAVAALALCVPVSALTPPEPYELAADGSTKLTLEQAGILKPDGRPWAILLGKALFWDQQTGSDGQSCASCHYHAGADTRKVNTFSPGLLKQPQADTRFGGVSSFDGEFVSAGAGVTRSGYPIDAGYELKPGDFPLYSLRNYADRNSDIEYATDDAVGSAGSFDTLFGRVRRAGDTDQCANAEAALFHTGGLSARQVAPRNTPTTINAAFNLFNFWDGRANRQFNGVGVFGPRDIAGDPRKRLVVMDAAGQPSLGFLRLHHASLASQAVGPAISEKEMSCQGRAFADLGRRMLLRRPLADQKVHPQDSVFGATNAVGNLDLRHVSGRGLKSQYLYADLIRRAFGEKYWKYPGRVLIDSTGKLRTAGPEGYTQMEQNFSMFWGVAIMLYERTLVSDQSRFDDWFASCKPIATNSSGTTVPVGNPTVVCKPVPTQSNQSTDPTAHGFTAQEVLGWAMFNNAGTGIRNPGNPSCNGCHNGPALFSEAQFQATPTQPFGATPVPVERSRIDLAAPPASIEANCITPTVNGVPTGGPKQCGGVHDRGFFNIGSRPTSLDPGNGGVDPYGNPLSMARMLLAEQAGEAVVDPTGIGNRCATPTLIEPGGTPPFPGCPSDAPARLDKSSELELVDGGFKTPSMRNIGLTPPYFHFGGYSNLHDVVRFYARGGSRRDKSKLSSSYTGDTSGSGPLGKGPVPPPGPHFGINVDFFIRDVKSTDEQIDALVAFMLTLTDRRVQCDMAPFDHPSLFISARPLPQDLNKDGRADDRWFELPETGRAGYDPQSGYCIPNKGDLFAPGMQSRSGGDKVPLQ